MDSGRFNVRVLTLTVVATMLATLFLPLASFAGSEGRRNTAIGLAGVAAYLLVKGKTTSGLATAAGAGYAYKRYQDERRDEQYRDRYGYYGSRDRGYYYGGRDRDRDRDCRVERGRNYDSGRNYGSGRGGKEYRGNGRWSRCR